MEKLRTELHNTSQGKLLTDPEVIRVSHALDILLVKYQKMSRDKGSK
ncbi:MULTISPECIES: aspartyl-phosphate phosphatase Spo0E family protein [Pelosinus]|uniref:Aspartyl-phosphate phosphatase Spo0E family protein n=1 Tax=Pelosinus baikalensis TaxID=2892015 RepID=A0ABS8HY67_9FIRM|nr:aspartyl-phosphate phosphatase Spo0E family protein [Pelosinus fermentans]MCC5468124.1 aspartyl-phosphate phosphatase Spo0E family protein [Pelosinus baikalensis]